MTNITISREAYDNLNGLRRPGETLTQALERMALALKESGVVATRPDRRDDDPWLANPGR